MSENETQKRPVDPDHVFVNAGKQETNQDKVYVSVPFNYRDANKALKEAGGQWKGSSWEFDKAAFAAAEDGVRAAARQDIALGKDGRKAREIELNPEREAERAKAREAKDAQRAEKSAKWEEAKANRTLVKDGALDLDDEGGVLPGQQIVTKDGSREVSRVGRSFEVDEKGLDRLQADFPEADVKVGDTVAYAYFEAPEPEQDATASPSA